MAERNLIYFVADVHLGLRLRDPAEREARFIDFLKGLPYKSRLMEMNNELWESWGPDEQNAFLSNLEAKINAYAAIHDDTSQWISLNEGDDPNDYVAPILLDLMP